MTTQKFKAPQPNSGKSITPPVRPAEFRSLLETPQILNPQQISDEPPVRNAEFPDLLAGFQPKSNQPKVRTGEFPDLLAETKPNPVHGLIEKFAATVREAKEHDDGGDIIMAIEKYNMAAAMAKAIHNLDHDTAQQLKRYKILQQRIIVLRQRVTTTKPSTSQTPVNQSTPNEGSATIRTRAFEVLKLVKKELDPNKKADIYSNAGTTYVMAGDMEKSINLKRFNYEDAQRCFYEAAQIATDDNTKAENVAFLGMAIQRTALLEEDSDETLRLNLLAARNLVNAASSTNDDRKKRLWMGQAKGIYEKAAGSTQEIGHDVYLGMAREVSKEMAKL
jgi:tetratricopeptide (TPR) repeat protein